jgi:predicted DNA-binding transcriptional regulator AlpA
MKQIIFTVDPEEYKKEIVSEIIFQINIARNNPNPSTRLLSRKESAKLLKIALSTLWKYTKNGDLKAYYIGNKVFYKENELIAGLKTID